MRQIASDGVVSPRTFDAAIDRQTIVDARDEESRRWLRAGSSAPAPTWCIEVDGGVVGWVDLDGDQPWLRPGEGNLGACVFPCHRRRGYAARAARLVGSVPLDGHLRRALVVIDRANTAWLVARAAGARRRSDRDLPLFPTSVVYGIELSGG